MSETLNELLLWDMMRITERTAIAAAKFRGRGDEMEVDKAALSTMREELNSLDVDGEVVIGEGDHDETEILYLGEKIGNEGSLKVDIALDPVEGTTLCAKALRNSISVLALAEPDSLLHAPDIYMEKIAIGPGYDEGVIDLEKSMTENLQSIAKAKNVEVRDLTTSILDRSRHAKLIEEVRSAGAAVRLISDGDISAVTQAADPDNTGVDVYLGIGGAPEGVLAAIALSSLGGQMLGRLIPMREGDRERAFNVGIEDLSKIYTISDMVKGEVLFAATGITSGSLLAGVKFEGDIIKTNTVIMHTGTKTIRWVKNNCSNYS